MKNKIKKIVGAVGVALLGLNLVMFSFRVYSDLIFWLVLAIVAAATYIALRLLK
ncbi:hypothetical protein KY308_03775 [Candidatus Woesearchaeota archaeon]|nr:hypothetical protein [Candidatus Woesearchaeota archaeon]